MALRSFRNSFLNMICWVVLHLLIFRSQMQPSILPQRATPVWMVNELCFSSIKSNSNYWGRGQKKLNLIVLVVKKKDRARKREIKREWERKKREREREKETEGEKEPVCIEGECTLRRLERGVKWMVGGNRRSDLVGRSGHQQLRLLSLFCFQTELSNEWWATSDQETLNTTVKCLWPFDHLSNTSKSLH